MITDTELIQYLDGALPADAVERVEQAVAADTTVRERLRDFAEEAALLRAALPIADEAQACVSRPTPRRAGRATWASWPAAVAASLVIGIGIAAGFLVSDLRADSLVSEFEAARALDRIEFEAAVQHALETQLSGRAVDWHNARSGNGGTVFPIRTFKSVEGAWCREYAHRFGAVSGTITRHAIACREADGDWVTRLPVYDPLDT